MSIFYFKAELLKWKNWHMSWDKMDQLFCKNLSQTQYFSKKVLIL